jgi:antitoxin component HigA of HigAB toxin-antitoxin module
MSTIAKNLRRNRTADSYLRLVQEQPLRAIRTGADYDAASKMIDRLAVRDNLDEGEQQYLDAIEVLIEAYENNVMPVTPDGRTPLERLKAAMRASQTTPVQLRSILGGSQSMVSMILGGKRALSKKAIAKLAGYFSLDPGYFL